MISRPFVQVDVFTDRPYLGNPVAVVLDGSGLSDDQMQQFARWTHLSETTFVLPPTPQGCEAGADYRVRIFTPGGELPFAGHPTLGTCHAWLEAGGQPRQPRRVGQECGVGVVTLQSVDGRRAFAAPALRRSAPSPTQLAQVAAALGVKAAQIVAARTLDNGTAWLALLLDSPDSVLALQPDHSQLKALGHKVGVAALQPTPAATLIARSSREARAFHVQAPPPADATVPAPDLCVRAFAAAVGVEEDPVTGSLNASLAQWLIEDGILHAPYVAAQGEVLGRDGRVYISRDAEGQVWVGGGAVSCIHGQVRL
jgi:PhzF family phenazine biosynthesis protein